MKNLAISLCLLISAFAAPLCAVPAQVVLIRSAEFNDSGDLTQKGIERAGALAGYLALTPYLNRYGAPVSLFAARPSPNSDEHPNDESQRWIQTLSGAGSLLSLPIHSGYARGQEETLANLILNGSYYNNKNVVICWHSSTIQQLAQFLGADAPHPFPSNGTSVTWVITYKPTIELTVYSQELLYGDPS